jgi:hypothetical protein
MAENVFDVFDLRRTANDSRLCLLRVQKSGKIFLGGLKNKTKNEYCTTKRDCKQSKSKIKYGKNAEKNGKLNMPKAQL